MPTAVDDALSILAPGTSEPDAYIALCSVLVKRREPVDQNELATMLWELVARLEERDGTVSLAARRATAQEGRHSR